MFSSLNTTSPQLATSSLDLYSPSSDTSELCDTGLTPSVNGEGNSYYHSRSFSYNNGGIEGGLASGSREDPISGLGVDIEDLPASPTPSPVSQPHPLPVSHGFNNFQHTAYPSSSLAGTMGQPPSGLRYPMPYMPNSLNPAFPPPIAGVYSASTALRSAVSHPAFTSSFSSRHEPYARSRYSSASSSSLSIHDHSRASSIASFPAILPDTRVYRSISGLSAGSTLSLDTTQSSHSNESMPYHSDMDLDFEIVTPQTAEFEQATSRYFDTLPHDASSSYPLAQSQEAVTALGAAPHLFMSGLDPQPAQKKASEEEDAATWRRIRGGGLFNEDTDEEDPVIGSMEEGEESETDTPLAVLRTRRLQLRSSPTPAFAASPTPTPASATVSDLRLLNRSEVEAIDGGLETLKGKVVIEKGQVAKKGKKNKGGGVAGLRPKRRGRRVGTQDTLDAVKSVDVEAVKDSGDALGLDLGQEAIGQVEPLNLDPAFASLDNLRSRSSLRNKLNLTLSPLPMSSNPTPGRSSASLHTISEISPVDIKPELLSSDLEYHPSGRIKRTGRPSLSLYNTIPTSLPSATTSTSAYDADEDSNSPTSDTAEWCDADDDEYASAPGTPMCQLRGGKKLRLNTGMDRTKGVETQEEYEERKRTTEPELWAKVESLRIRLMDGSRKMRTFDEKLCQALVDERFSPKYIAWSEDGTSIVISNLLGFLSAGHYVMNTSQKRSAFEKQLSNHEFGRTSFKRSSTVYMTLRHPRLSRDDDELWAAVRQLPVLIKTGTSLIGSVRGSTVANLRRINKAQSVTYQALQVRVQTMIQDSQAEKEDKELILAALGAMKKDHPGLFTAKNLKKYGFKSTDILIPLTTIQDVGKLNTNHFATSVTQSSPVAGPSRGVTKKRSRHGRNGTPLRVEVESDDEIKKEDVEEVEKKSVSRKKSKITLKGGK